MNKGTCLEKCYYTGSVEQMGVRLKGGNGTMVPPELPTGKLTYKWLKINKPLYTS